MSIPPGYESLRALLAVLGTLGCLGAGWKLRQFHKGRDARKRSAQNIVFHSALIVYLTLVIRSVDPEGFHNLLAYFWTVVLADLATLMCMLQLQSFMFSFLCSVRPLWRRSLWHAECALFLLLTVVLMSLSIVQGVATGHARTAARGRKLVVLGISLTIITAAAALLMCVAVSRLSGMLKKLEERVASKAALPGLPGVEGGVPPTPAGRHTSAPSPRNSDSQAASGRALRSLRLRLLCFMPLCWLIGWGGAAAQLSRGVTDLMDSKAAGSGDAGSSGDDDAEQASLTMDIVFPVFQFAACTTAICFVRHVRTSHRAARSSKAVPAGPAASAAPPSSSPSSSSAAWASRPATRVLAVKKAAVAPI